MKQKTVFVVLSGLSASSLLLGQASPCRPSAQQVAQTLGGRARTAREDRGSAAQQVPRNLTITAIPGVVAGGGKWMKVWQAAGNSADGIIPDKDGSVLVAQEDYDTVLKIDANGNSSVAVADAKGIGSLSMDRQGRLYGVYRTRGPDRPSRAARRS